MRWRVSSSSTSRPRPTAAIIASRFERCLEEIGWAAKSPLQGKLVGGRYHGLAIGCYFEGGASGPRESARLVLERDATVSVYVGSSANGQGLETVFGQIAADALEMPLDRIRGVFHGSTDLVREGFGSYSSRSVVMGGSAIIDAAGKLRDAIRSAAARRLGCAAADIVLADGAARGPGREAIALGDLAEDNLSADGSYASAKRTYSYGAHAAHVAVDPRTGAVEVIDYVAVEDVGRIINPATLHGQAVGAIVQGLGGVFLEHLVYDEQAQLLTGSLADYLLPTASDFPAVRAVALAEKPAPHNPLGAKGAGEGGIIPVGGVIANAIAAALRPLGIEPRELPLSPPRLWALIDAARAARAEPQPGLSRLRNPGATSCWRAPPLPDFASAQSERASAALGTPPLSRSPLGAVGVEILRRKPAFERGLSRRPVGGQHGEPGGVAAARLDDHVVAKDAFEAKAEAQRGAARRGVERIAFPLVAAIAERLEGVAGQQILRLGGERRALEATGSAGCCRPRRPASPDGSTSARRARRRGRTVARSRRSMDRSTVAARPANRKTPLRRRTGRMPCR